MKIRFKKLRDEAVLPSHSKPGDAGLDLTATDIQQTDTFQERHYYGLAVEIPRGYVGLIFPRSSIFNFRSRLSNCVGVIDSGYRGEITAIFDNNALGSISKYEAGNRTAQMVIVAHETVDAEWAEELSESERGVGGYGHTGK